eukprot:3735630-Rhodomonas_salina.2
MQLYRYTLAMRCPVLAYAPAAPSPVLTWHVLLQPGRTGASRGGHVPPIVLRPRYAMSDTDVGHAGTRSSEGAWTSRLTTLDPGQSRLTTLDPGQSVLVLLLAPCTVSCGMSPTGPRVGVGYLVRCRLLLKHSTAEFELRMPSQRVTCQRVTATIAHHCSC